MKCLSIDFILFFSIFNEAMYDIYYRVQLDSK